MPLFTNKFSTKSIPLRQQETCVLKREFGSDYAAKELSPDIGPLKLKLGDFEVCFEDGQWIPASGRVGAAYKENSRLKKELQQLEEENNMLRLKFEILLDMVTDTAVSAEEEIKATSMTQIRGKGKKK